MFVVLAALLAIFVVPDPWGVPLVVGAVLLEIGETLFWIRFTRRWPTRTGVETLIGASGRVVEPCRPIGTVRVKGEVWRARCDGGADRDEAVRVRDREGLTLVVDRA